MRTRKRKQRGGNTLQQINTGNKNLYALNMLQMPKPPLQVPGQIVNGLQQQQGAGKRKSKRRMYGKGPAIVDRYGAFVHAY